MSTKYRDRNGFLHLEGVPISRVQVAPYLGKQIDSKHVTNLEPKKIYGVYRSPEELFNEKTMNSFNGMPFRVGHQMMGKGDPKKTKKVDNTPIDGCFFNVRRGKENDTVKSGDPRDYLFADIVIYTERALRSIAEGVTELSLGYRCSYVPQEGEYDGQPYHYVQKNIVANHLALVPAGRAGSSVCVDVDDGTITEDGLVITCDSLPEELQIMEDNEKKAKEELKGLLSGSDENVQDCLDYCHLTKEQKEAIKAMKGKDAGSAPADDGKKEGEGDAKPTDTPTQDAACPGCAQDANPPTPPPAVTDNQGGDDDGKGAAPAPDAGAPAPDAGTPNAGAAAEPNGEVATAPAAGAAPAGDVTPPPATVTTDAAPAANDKPVETVTTEEIVGTVTPDAGAAAPDAGTSNDVTPVDNGAAPAEGDDNDPKTYTQDELDDACAKARKEGRLDGLRAKALAEAVGEDAADLTEAQVARKACKKIKGLEHYAEDSASDSEVLAAIRGHLAHKIEEKKAEKPQKKTLLTVDTNDEAIAKTPAFSAANLTQFLAQH